jgi:predicted DNA-binding mobile mystery protein A
MIFYVFKHNNFDVIIYIYINLPISPVNSQVGLMKTHFDDVTLSQISRRIEEIRKSQVQASIRGGWISYMRNALGLTLSDLSKLLGQSIPTVAQAEKREVEGKITLQTLEKIAEAMECELVYSFVPKKEIKTFIKDKAREKATKSLMEADLHMKLENQKVEGEMNERIERLAKKLIEKGDIW